MAKITEIIVLKDEKTNRYKIYVEYKNAQIESYTCQGQKEYEEDMFNIAQKGNLTPDEYLNKSKVRFLPYNEDLIKKLNTLQRNISSLKTGILSNRVYNFVQLLIQPLVIFERKYEFGAQNINKLFDPLYSSLSLLSPLIFLILYYKDSKELEKFEKDYLSSHKFKIGSRIRSLLALTGLLTFFNTTGVDVSYLTHLDYEWEVSKTDLDDLVKDNVSKEAKRLQKIDLIFNKLDENPYLSQEDLATFKNLKEYFEENPYLDYNKLYKKLATHRVFEKKRIINDEEIGNTIVNGACFPEENYSFFYDINSEMYDYNRQEVMFHEFLHLTGDLPKNIDEGLVSCLQIEYLNIPYTTPLNSYQTNILVVRYLTKLIGRDKMLEAFSTSNVNIIYDELEKIYGENYKEVLDKFDFYIENFKNLDHDQMTSILVSIASRDLTGEHQKDIYKYLDVNDYYLNYEYMFNIEPIIEEGCLQNKVLNEGLKKCLSIEYSHLNYANYNFDLDNYNIYVARVLGYLIGKDTLLEAYQNKNDELIINALVDIYGSREKVNYLFKQLEEYANAYLGYRKYLENKEIDNDIIAIFEYEMEFNEENLYYCLTDGNLTEEQINNIPKYLYLKSRSSIVNMNSEYMFATEKDFQRVLKNN